MATRTFNPTSPGVRTLVQSQREQLTRINGTKATPKPEKSLLAKKRRTNGRDNYGHISCRHRGGGHRQHYRLVDFKRDKEEVPAKVASIEYDPNRTAFIALLHYVDGVKTYIIAPKGLKEGDTVVSGSSAPFKVGCCMMLKNMPEGSVVHNIELKPGAGGKIVRSAGLSAQFLGKANGYATLRLPSGEMRLVPEECRATFGAVSNSEHNLRVEGKAGRMRWKGWRPTVRGTAMNPVDHPHGGGEGRTRGNIPQSPWAQYTKGLKTRSHKKASARFIIKGRKKK